MRLLILAVIAGLFASLSSQVFAGPRGKEQALLTPHPSLPLKSAIGGFASGMRGGSAGKAF